jgi:hypothetical protein
MHCRCNGTRCSATSSVFSLQHAPYASSCLCAMSAGQLLLLLLLSIVSMASCWSHEQCELIAAIKRSNDSHARSSMKGVDEADAAQVAQQWLQQQQPPPLSFLLPAVDSLNEKMVKLLLRAKSTFISTTIGDVHVIDAQGKGPLPPVILLHGITSRAADFAPLMSRLLKDCRRVVAIDMPGKLPAFCCLHRDKKMQLDTTCSRAMALHTLWACAMAAATLYCRVFDLSNAQQADFEHLLQCACRPRQDSAACYNRRPGERCRSLSRGSSTGDASTAAA